MIAIPDERGISLLADVLGDARQRGIASTQQVGGKQHSPLRQILHGCAADELLEALGEETISMCPPRAPGSPMSTMRRACVQLCQRGTYDAIAHGGEPTGPTCTLFVHVQAQDLDKKYLSQQANHQPYEK